MPTRSYTEVIRGIQGALGPLFKSRGFQVLGLTYNRPTKEGLTQVINIQVSPRTLPYPRWQDYEARLTFYVPEIAWYFADVFYETRNKILEMLKDADAAQRFTHLPELLKTVILWERGERDRAQKVISEYMQGIKTPAHEEFVRQLAEKLGISQLNVE